MADINFDGVVLQSSDKTSNTSLFVSTVMNQQAYYQAYFYSADPSTRPHMWNDVRQCGFTGQWQINLGDDDWLTPTGVSAAGDKVIIVFWQNIDDRLDTSVLNYMRGWIEIVITGYTSYTRNVMFANTNISYTYSDDMPDRYGVLDNDYNFHYSSEFNETYDLGYLMWYDQLEQTYFYNDSNITVSQEDTVYGEQIFPIITSIRETLTFSPEGDYIQRTLSPVTTDFTHSFDTFQRHQLIRTIEYLVSGSYYDGNKAQIIHDYFVELKLRRPGSLNIDVYRDRDFSLVINTDRVDFWTFKGVIKESSSSTTVLVEFDIDIDEVEETLTLSLDSNTTKDLITNTIITAGSSSTVKQLVWDLKIINPLANTYNFIEGDCLLHDTVTRAM